MHLSPPRPLRRVAGLLALLGTTMVLGACAGIPQRAFVNGAAMGPQLPLQFQSMRDMSAMRARYYQASPLVRHQRPYQPFTHW